MKLPWSRSDGGILARLALPTDRPSLSALWESSWKRHGVAAVEEQMVLLNSGLSTVAFGEGQPAGFMGLSMREPVGEPLEHWVDLRMAAMSPNVGVRAVMPALLSAATPVLRSVSATGVVALVGEDWLRQALGIVRFAEIDQIVSYVHRGTRIPESPDTGIVLRNAAPRDAETILRLNSLAFAPFWRYDPAKTLSWLLTADYPIVAELDGRPVGFAITTSGNGEYAHLIRIGIDPEVQGRGIGKALVCDAIRYAGTRGLTGLALNTQASNRVSRHIYEALDFVVVSPRVAVLVYQL